jgi:hypothetical protein
MKEEWWTLVMTLAWIAKRDTGSVRHCFDPYRLECFDWHFREWRIGFDGPHHKGWFLEGRKPATFARFSLSHRYEGLRANDLHVDDAESQLTAALRAGQVVATGRPADGKRRIEIPCYEWNDLTIVEESGRDVARDNPHSVKGYDEILLRRKAVVGLWPEHLPASLLDFAATVAPEGAGYFPLYCAAHWIATIGGTRNFDPGEISIWQAAYGELTARISSGQILVTGVRDGAREKIEGHLFASIRVDYPYQEPPLDMLLGEELYLCSYPYADEEHWQKGFDDSLRTRDGKLWSKLLVLKSDIREFWPYGLAASASPPAVATGAPGRPTSMHIVSVEHQRRLGSGEAALRVRQEAKALAEWLKKTHPVVPTLTAKTIENNIRATHRETQKARN